jgi:tartrate dehydrogenase/decarboxylase/D-malate dehydrogenase
VRSDLCHVDALAAKLVLRPDQFDVIVATNLFGDILSDLGPACTGTIGIAPSANLNPTRRYPSLFEPVHGSAPDIAGRGIANPIGQIWSVAMMLDHLGQPAAAQAVVDAIEAVLVSPDHDRLTTPDLGGTGTTAGLGAAIADALPSPG